MAARARILPLAALIGALLCCSPAEPGVPSSDPDYVSTSRSICSRCAQLLRSATRHWTIDGKDVSHDSEKIEDTPLSDRLDSWHAPRCDHDWVHLSHAVHGSRSGHGITRIDGATIDILSDTGGGADALVAFAGSRSLRPRSVWRTMTNWCRLNGEDTPFFYRLKEDDPDLGKKVKRWLEKEYTAIERSANDEAYKRATTKLPTSPLPSKSRSRR